MRCPVFHILPKVTWEMMEAARREYHDAMQELKAGWLKYRHHDAELIDIPEYHPELQPFGGIPIDALEEGPQPKPLELFTQKITLRAKEGQCVPRSADTLVGIHLLPDNVCQHVTVDVWIGGTPMSQLMFCAGDKRLVIEDATCCHMTAICYHDLYLFSGSAATFSLVYCNFPMQARRYAVMTSHCYLIPLHLRTEHTLGKSIFVIETGMGTLVAGDDKDVAYMAAQGHSMLMDIWEGHLPPASCMQRLDALKEELMAAAWHPDRMAEWCWDDEDKRELEELQP